MVEWMYVRADGRVGRVKVPQHGQTNI
jgi:hypothetical protein